MGVRDACENRPVGNRKPYRPSAFTGSGWLAHGVSRSLVKAGQLHGFVVVFQGEFEDRGVLARFRAFDKSIGSALEPGWPGKTVSQVLQQGCGAVVQHSRHQLASFIVS